MKMKWRGNGFLKRKSSENAANSVVPEGFLWCPDSELNQGHVEFSVYCSTYLSYLGHGTNFSWWAIRDLNPGPAGYEPDALTN